MVIYTLLWCRWLVFLRRLLALVLNIVLLFSFWWLSWTTLLDESYFYKLPISCPSVRKSSIYSSNMLCVISHFFEICTFLSPFFFFYVALLNSLIAWTRGIMRYADITRRTCYHVAVSEWLMGHVTSFLKRIGHMAFSNWLVALQWPTWSTINSSISSLCSSLSHIFSFDIFALVRPSHFV